MGRFTPRPLPEQVVVVLGASSGIGRLTALDLAARGSTVVVASRDGDALDALVDEITEKGGRASAVRTDIGQWGQVEALAAKAAAEHGRIDAWVTVAGIAMWAPVQDATVEDIKQVIDVDLMGPIHAIKAALPHLRTRGGVIVTVSSGLGARAVPLMASYCAAKRGILGFTESLRLELWHDDIPVELVDVVPASINTPFFQHARSTLSQRPKPIPPVYQPETVSIAIAAALERPTRTVFVGRAAKALDIAERISPTLTDRLLMAGRIWERQLSKRGRAHVQEPAVRGSTSLAFPRSAYTRASQALASRVREVVRQGDGPVGR